MSTESALREINISIQPSTFRAIELVARRDHRSVPQMAEVLLEEALRRRSTTDSDDTNSLDLAALAAAGGGFDWLNGESDLYDDSCGEPLSEIGHVLS